MSILNYSDRNGATIGCMSMSKVVELQQQAYDKGEDSQTF